MKLFTTIFAIFIIGLSFSQEETKEKISKIDSLQNELTLNHSDSIMVQIHLEIANEYYLQDPNKALEFALEASDIAINASLHEEILEAYNWVGYIYWQQGKLQEALEIYKKAIDESYEYEYNDISILLNNIGYVYKDLGDFDTGLSYLQKALKMREIAKDTSGLSNSLNNIGLVYKDLGEYDKALEYLEKSYSFHIKSNEEKQTGNTLNNIAIIWSIKGDLEKSRGYLVKALKVSEEVENYNSMAMILDNIGNNFFKKGELDSAYIYHLKSIEVCRKVDALYWESSAHLHLGKIMLLKNNIKVAEEKTLAAYAIAEKTGYPDRLRDISEQLSIIYEQKGDSKKALKYHKEYIVMRDSIDNVANKKMLFKQEVNYDYEKKKLADSLVNIKSENLLNAKIDKQNALTKSMEKEQEQNFIWTLMAGGVLFLAVFFLLRINAIRKNSNTALSEKNNQISKTSSDLKIALDERNTLLKEIHHRVKNNLQTVSSLLSLQSRYLDDPNASKALEESRSRLNSISLLHQKLYQNENLPVVVLSEYLKELTNQILETCDTIEKSISLQLYCDELKCDIEQAMPIGLIINELLTNSFKYAFGDMQEGQINVSLTNIEADKFKLVISDNGVGLPEGFELKGGNSMGLNLVTLLTRQMKGTVRASNNDGAEFVIEFIMKKKHS